jgi:hypothetical protein
MHLNSSELGVVIFAGMWLLLVLGILWMVLKEG